MTDAEELLKSLNYTVVRYASYLCFSTNTNAYLLLQASSSYSFEERNSDNDTERQIFLRACSPSSYSGSQAGDYILYRHDYSSNSWEDITGTDYDRGCPITEKGVDLDTFFSRITWLYSNYNVLSAKVPTGSTSYTSYTTKTANNLDIILKPKGYLGSAKAAAKMLVSWANPPYPQGIVDSKANTLQMLFQNLGSLWIPEIKEGDILLICVNSTKPLKYVFDRNANIYNFERITPEVTDGSEHIAFYKVVVSSTYVNYYNNVGKNLYMVLDSTQAVDAFATVMVFDGDIVDTFVYHNGTKTSTVGDSSYLTTVEKPSGSENYVWGVRCLTAVRTNPLILGTDNNVVKYGGLLSAYSPSSSTASRFATEFDDVPNKYISTDDDRSFVIVRDNYQKAEMIIDGVEVVYKDRSEVYILESNDHYYTIQNGALVSLTGIDELTSAVMLEYGFDTIPDWDTIDSLTDPVLYFHNKKGGNTKRMHMEMTALPRYSFVETDNIYIDSVSAVNLAGIEIDASTDSVVTFSRDDGETWFYIDEDTAGNEVETELYDKNTSVGNTLSEFTSKYSQHFRTSSGAFTLKIRVLIYSAESYANGVTIHYGPSGD